MPTAEELTKDLTEKLQEYEEEQRSEIGDQVDQPIDSMFKVICFVNMLNESSMDIVKGD
jgi:hypothetical protein